MNFGKTNFLTEAVSLVKVFACFTREADDDISTEDQSPLSPPFDKGGKSAKGSFNFIDSVGTVH